MRFRNIFLCVCNGIVILSIRKKFTKTNNKFGEVKSPTPPPKKMVQSTGNVDIALCLHFFNRPFPSCLVPQFHSESSCETIEMKMSLICMKMDIQVKHIFIRTVSHEDSFRHRGSRELGNGLFVQVVKKMLI